MKSITTLSIIITAVVALSVLSITAAAPTAPSPAAAKAIPVDVVHSSLVFKIRYQSITDFHGRFNDFSGTFSFDPHSLEDAAFDIAVKAASVDTGNERRDGHLKSPDFFSAKEHPEMRFQSTGVKKTGENTYDVSGTLTLRGVEKPVTAKVVYGGRVEGRRGGQRVGLDGTLTIDRTDFGITFGEGSLGKDVEITMGLTGVAR